MRSFITALAMVAVATTSFAIGRSTSGSGTGAKPVVAESAATIDTTRLHASIGELPAMPIDSPF